MARNPNTSHTNAHHLYLGVSGSGKTYRVATNPRVKNAARVLLWDPDRDFEKLGRAKVHRTGDLREYYRWLRQAIAQDKPFRLALTTRDDPEIFDAWSRLVWAAADGDRPVVVVCEELASVANSGKAAGFLGDILRRGRKYGLELHFVAQRAAEIPNTIRNQSQVLWCGIQGGEQLDTKRAASMLAITPEQVSTLKPRAFWYRHGAEPAVLIGPKDRAPPL